jgi:uncharacterized protein YgiM (DUF1202 family)
MKDLFFNYYKKKYFPPDSCCLHFILVANSSEPQLGRGCKNDAYRAMQTVKTVCEILDIPLKIAEINGDGYNKAGVEAVIKSLMPCDKDIVFFYYTGHGFNKMEEAHLFPTIDLRNNPANNDAGIIDFFGMDMEKVFEKIKSKGGRLNLVVSDCCNFLTPLHFTQPLKKSTTGRNKQPTPKTNAAVLQGPYNKKATSLLFLQSNLSVLVTAAGRGQYAMSDPEYGSVFGMQFFDEINNILCSRSFDWESFSWNNILTNTLKATLEEAACYAADDTHPEEPAVQVARYKIEALDNKITNDNLKKYFPSVASAGSPLKVSTDSGSLNIRRAPAADGSIAGQALKDEMVTLLEKTSDNWWKIITNNGVEGYAAAEYLLPRVKVNTSTNKLNIRSTPEGSGNITKGRVMKEEMVTLLEKTTDDWWKIITKDGLEGYAAAKYLCPEVKVNTIDDDLNIRITPHDEGKIAGHAFRGGFVILLEKTNKFWWKIVTKEGVKGYVYAKYLLLPE